ncbi:hypothetical protein GTW51_14940 [Aurantimonas aggregata]|uniref:Uncharacterized protein n=1 Tax=Aurantimonas aggregata TaxID=2047720 RepID=A0A6L9MJJ0_9HYPH|nr:hypothetical protein [Aurantimonas aggregata]NDV87999.1 hypothetical protein [Aurantimonas aggregata]
MKMLVTAVLKCERADTEPQAILDWLDEAARKAGMPMEMAQVLPHDLPAKPDPTLTEVGTPD